MEVVRGTLTWLISFLLVDTSHLYREPAVNGPGPRGPDKGIETPKHRKSLETSNGQKQEFTLGSASYSLGPSAVTWPHLHCLFPVPSGLNSSGAC